MPASPEEHEQRTIEQRSMLRHRPIHTDDIQTEVPKIPRASRHHWHLPEPETETEQDYRQYPARRDRYQTDQETEQDYRQYPARRDRYQTDQERPPARTKKAAGTREKQVPHRKHQIFYLGIGMLCALVLVIVGQWCVQNFIQLDNTLRYGNPRTFQTDAFVGNEPAHTPSHFIALNLQGNIEVIELPGGDSAHAVRYQITRLNGPGAAQAPVTLHFVASTNPKYPDMVVNVQNTQLYLRNNNGVFHLA
jgi:hypothetical protein